MNKWGRRWLLWPQGSPAVVVLDKTGVRAVGGSSLAFRGTTMDLIPPNFNLGQHCMPSSRDACAGRPLQSGKSVSESMSASVGPCDPLPVFNILEHGVPVIFRMGHCTPSILKDWLLFCRWKWDWGEECQGRRDAESGGEDFLGCF